MEHGTPGDGTLQEYPTKSAAQRAAHTAPPLEIPQT